MPLRSFRNHLKKNSGFTLIETVLALFILMLIFLMLTPLLQLNHQYLEELNDTTKQDWYVFTIQLEQTIKDFELLSVSETRLIFQSENDKEEIKKPVIEYYANKKLVRKSSINGGYEPMLMNVEKIKFSYEGHFVRMKVEFLNGECYEYCIFKQKA